MIGSELGCNLEWYQNTYFGTSLWKLGRRNFEYILRRLSPPEQVFVVLRMYFVHQTLSDSSDLDYFEISFSWLRISALIKLCPMVESEIVYPLQDFLISKNV